MSNPYDLARSILQKISCTLSATGSLMITSQVLRKKANRVKLQQRILLAISFCDFCTSTVWVFTDLFMPPRGNQRTCDAQGFIIQFGNTSNMMLMVALQVQYLLIIKYGWSETKMKKLEPFLLILPFCFGTSTATAALSLKLFNPANWDCWIAPYPDECTSSYEISHGNSDLEVTDCVRGDNARIFQWAFFFALLWAVAVFCIFVMIMITKSVEKAERKSASFSVNANRPNRPTQTTRRHSIQALNADGRLTLTDVNVIQRRTGRIELVLTTRVKMQCILYALGFFVVWGFPTIARMIQLFGGTIHPILLPLSGFFVGSQGLWNAMIYFRSKYSTLLEDHWWQKLWRLIKLNLLFCFEYDGEERNDDGGEENDHVSSSIARSFLTRAGASKWSFFQLIGHGENSDDTLRSDVQAGESCRSDNICHDVEQ
mmetsp:Transcript_18623/g.38975  ORF Transcript_18623/g.38975 Transcript_18623/m.38975 type:complete len:429 (-) Transcript_18623:88-1374(-)